MVHYAVDTDPRPRTLFLLAAVAVLGAFLFSLWPPLADYKFAAPSAMTLFGALVWLYDRFLWKSPVLCVLSGIPNLSGKWVGTLTRPKPGMESEREMHGVEVTITQTWRKIEVFVRGQATVSSLRAAALFVENPDNVLLRYSYEVRPLTGLEEPNLYGEGFTELRHERQGAAEFLRGPYYSTKLRKGFIDIHREGSG